MTFPAGGTAVQSAGRTREYLENESWQRDSSTGISFYLRGFLLSAHALPGSVL